MITSEVIKPQFDVIAKTYSKYCYFFKHCYNMNESKFIIGTNQSSKISINICKK